MLGGVQAAVLALFATTAQTDAELIDRLRVICSGPDVRLRSATVDEQRAVIGLEVADHVDLGDLPAAIEARYETAVGAITAARMTPRIDLLVAHAGKPLAPPPTFRRTNASNIARRESVTRDIARYPHGQALLGRTVALSPGHGWIFNSNLNRYATQRGNIKWDGCGTCRGIVEDFETHEVVIDHLIPLLEGAGARVILVRDRGRSTSVALVDDGDAAFSQNGVVIDGANAGGHGDDYRASTDPSGTFEWTITPPTAGRQLLSTWFVAGSNRYADARLTVTGPGGVHEFLLDQTAHGRRWAPIGVFDVGPQLPLTIRLTPPATSIADKFVVGDAMRLGAGMHSSGHPWWQMGAAPFAAYQNAPAEIQARGDVTIRPRYAEWYGADVYVSVHSNASGQPNSTAAGTSTYRFNCGQFSDHSSDPPAAQCDDPTGSDRLQELVHNALVAQVTADWDQNWRDRGTRVANFGELRELDGIPGILIESAFHDNVQLAAGSTLRMTDNQALHDPRWRRAAAFGIYKGISEFLVGAGPLLAPPPQNLFATRIDSTTVELAFDASPSAAGHRVYLAAGQRMFDEGRIVGASPVRIGSLPADIPCFFAVAALNAAGEGLRSSVVGAVPSARRAQVLVIDAFEREDAWVQTADNRHDSVMTHGLAMAPSGVVFDGAQEGAIAAGQLANYDAVVIALGRESTEHGVLNEGLRTALTAFAANGGAVFASGSEIGWALDSRGDAASRMFLDTVFGVALERDDAGELAVQVAPSGWLAMRSNGATWMLDDGTGPNLWAQFSDVFTPAIGTTVELTYGTGTGAAAVRQGKNLAVGFAVESLVDPNARVAMLGGWLDQAIVIEPPMIADAGGIDAGRVDADQVDADQVDAGQVDADAVDARGDDATAGDQDAGVAGSGRVLRPAFGTDEPITGGCGCAATDPQSDLPAVTFVMALFGLVIMRRRVRRWRRGTTRAPRHRARAGRSAACSRRG